MRRLAHACLTGLLLIACAGGVRASPPPMERAADGSAALTAEQAKRELAILKRALVALHPGLYRYQTPEAFEAGFARAEAEVANGSSAFRMYLIAGRIAAAVRCGHTWTNPLNQGEALQASLAALPALPVRVRLLEGRLLVTASADPQVPAMAELVRIDGRTPATLVDEFLPYLRADGDSDGKRLSQIDSDENGGAMDRLLPLLHPPGADGYALALRLRDGTRRQVRVASMTAAERERQLAPGAGAGEDEAWTFVIEGDTAIMTLPTFAFWNSDFDWRGFLQRSFDRLAEARIDKLVLDLRRNEGGDDSIGDALQAHLLTQPYTVAATRAETAYERAPYDLVRYLDTWDFGFFDHTGEVVRGPGRNWVAKQQAEDRVIAPVAHPYRGRVVLLTGPRMSSAGFLVARNLKASGSATLIGQPTGGSLRGLNGGQLAWLVLPTSGVSVDIPLLAAFAKTDQPAHGVMPDIAVRTTLDDVAAGIDPDLVAARRWLHRAP